MRYIIPVLDNFFSVDILCCIIDREKQISDFFSGKSQNVLKIEMHEINRTSLLCDFIFSLSKSLNNVFIISASYVNKDTIETRWIKQI